eukprot:c23127_g1_i3 orf=436-1569(-)
MGRKGLPIELRHDEIKRKDTFAKRCKGLFKKAHELSAICGSGVYLLVGAECGTISALHRLKNEELTALPRAKNPKATIKQVDKRMFYNVCSSRMEDTQRCVEVRERQILGAMCDCYDCVRGFSVGHRHVELVTQNTDGASSSRVHQIQGCNLDLLRNSASQITAEVVEANSDNTGKAIPPQQPQIWQCMASTPLHVYPTRMRMPLHFSSHASDNEMQQRHYLSYQHCDVVPDVNCQVGNGDARTSQTSYWMPFQQQEQQLERPLQAMMNRNSQQGLGPLSTMPTSAPNAQRINSPPSGMAPPDFVDGLLSNVTNYVGPEGWLSMNQDPTRMNDLHISNPPHSICSLSEKERIFGDLSFDWCEPLSRYGVDSIKGSFQ